MYLQRYGGIFMLFWRDGRLDNFTVMVIIAIVNNSDLNNWKLLYS